MRTALDSLTRLPEAARDEISAALANGKTWRAIAVIAEKHGLKGVQPTNVTNYRQSKVHKAWQAKQERIAAIRADQANAQEIFEAARSEGLSPADAACAVAARKVLAAVEGLDLDAMLASSENPGTLAIGILRAATNLAETLRKVPRPVREPDAAAAPKASAEEKTQRMKEFFGLA